MQLTHTRTHTHLSTLAQSHTHTHTHMDACALSSDIKIICQAQNLGQAALKQTECVSEVCAQVCVCMSAYVSSNLSTCV